MKTRRFIESLLRDMEKRSVKDNGSDLLTGTIAFFTNFSALVIAIGNAAIALQATERKLLTDLVIASASYLDSITESCFSKVYVTPESADSPRAGDMLANNCLQPSAELAKACTDLPESAKMSLLDASHTFSKLFVVLARDLQFDDGIARKYLLYLIDAFADLQTQIISVRLALGKPAFCPSFVDTRRALYAYRQSLVGFGSVREALQSVPLLNLPGRLISRRFGVHVIARRIELDPMNPFLQKMLSDRMVMLSGLSAIAKSARIASGHVSGVLTGMGIRAFLEMIDGPKPDPAIVYLNRAIELADRRLRIDANNDAVLLVLCASLHRVGLLTESEVLRNQFFERSLRGFVILLARTNRLNIAADACRGIADIYVHSGQTSLASRYKALSAKLSRDARRKYRVKRNISIYEQIHTKV